MTIRDLRRQQFTDYQKEAVVYRAEVQTDSELFYSFFLHVFMKI